MEQKEDQQEVRSGVEIVLHYLMWALFLGGMLSSCTVTKPPVATPPMLPSPVAATPTPPPEFEPIEAEVEAAPQDPDVTKMLRKHEKTKKFTDITTPAVMKYVFDPMRIYTLSCPDQGVLLIRLLPGEVIRDIAAGNRREWQIAPTRTGLGEETAIITAKRTEYAQAIQMTVITDANVYEFLLKPGGPLGNGRTRQAWFWDPSAELRKYQARLAAEERRRQKAQESRLPTLSPEHVRYYDIGGDRVVWRPLYVNGDHRHTMVFLPAATGTEQPTLQIIQDGMEVSPNARTVPGRSGEGAVIVVDQAFEKAVLKGQGGVVQITGRGN